MNRLTTSFMSIRSAISSTTAFHTGWCNVNPSASCRRVITRLRPGVTGSASAMHSASSFSSSTRPLASSPQNTQPASHRLAALQRKQRDCRLLRSSDPHWFLGMMWSTSRARWCGVCQATAGAAAFAAAFGPGEHPVFNRAADRGAVAAPVPEAAGFYVSKQHTSSPRCIREASRRWRHSSSNWSRSASLSSSPPTMSVGARA